MASMNLMNLKRLVNDKRLDDDDESRRLDSTRVWQHFWDRLERLERLDAARVLR